MVPKVKEPIAWRGILPDKSELASDYSRVFSILQGAHRVTV
ncbi:hypothetical protein [Iningainema tapete]|nr:hypothetical protein [Iningainema tapete]